MKDRARIGIKVACVVASALIPVLLTLQSRREAVEPPMPAAAPIRHVEIGDLRAVWAHASSTKTRENAEALLDRVEAAHMNCIYWLGFYWGGKTFFENDLLPMPDTIEEGFDPLAYLCEEGHRRGIEIHVRFVNGAHGSDDPAPIFDKHPDWAQVVPSGADELWYDFNRPEVRAFQADLMLQAATRYPIDGVQFDFVRYGNAEGCMCDRCLAEFEEETGYSITGWDETKLPTIVTLKANPLVGVTTAKVLAEFGDGVPAITMNTYGDGETLLLNWHAEDGPGALPTTILRKALDEWEAPPGSIVCLHSQEAAGYHAKYGGSAERLLASVGRTAQWAEPLAVGDPAPPVAIAPNLYRMSEAEAEAIADMIHSGTRMVFIDGPIYAIEHQSLAEVLGLSSDGKWLSGPVAMIPKAETGLFDVGRTGVDLSRIAALPDLWWSFQADHITDLVRDVSQRVRRLPRTVVVSADVFHRRASAESLLQDWHTWVKQGLVDYVLPMAYVHDEESLLRSVAEWRETDPSFSRIVPGLMIYESDANPTPLPPEVVLNQIGRCRDSGMTGVSLFHHPTLTPELAAALANGPWAEPAPRGPGRSAP